MEPIENQAPTSEPAATVQPASESVVVGEQQPDVQGTESAEPVERQESTSDQSIPDDWEWDGNVDNLPKPLQTRGKGMLRHLHKVSQEAAKVKREAETYQKLVSDPVYQEFVKAKQQGTLQQQLQGQMQQYQISEQDWEAAQTDPQSFSKLVNNLAGQQVNQIINQYAPVIQDLQRKVAISNAEREIDAFASQHPDFYEIDPRIMETALSQVGKQGGGIVEAYNLAKEIESSYVNKVQSSMQKEVQKKKAAVTAPPSRTANPSVVYATSAEEARRIAFENAALGKKVEVRRKPTK